ncbi:bZIP transcription factor TRAB1-like isoform X2 [Hibiscus syriacus]|uniref:bZIP transcription factor TRAB1-like isoform X2 n=1 Tax=Hibiscus syriacus TaxID=106335 RepID=UPI0019250B4D|nr:bZIP transcription factor TRAB1-like isoform X2 [Hibiscus syriacus]
MGIQTTGSQSNDQQPLSQPSPLMRQNSWYSLTLNEFENQMGNVGKPLGSMNLDELLNNVWSNESNPTLGMNNGSISSSSSLPRQASLTLVRALNGKMVDQVWTEIQQGQKRRYGEEMKDHKREPTLGETTLEDFLLRSSPTPSIGTISDTPMTGRKRDAEDAFEKSIERRLRRKIKNRESAARSRARMQAYHNELVNKVSRLEEDNIKLKREKEFDIKFQCETSEPNYQLRRTSSAIF